MPVSICNLKKNRSNFEISSKIFSISLLIFEKSIKIYDLYSFRANSSAIVVFPTRLAPSSKQAYFPFHSLFHSKSWSYTFLLNIFFHLSVMHIVCGFKVFYTFYPRNAIISTSYNLKNIVISIFNHYIIIFISIYNS